MTFRPNLYEILEYLELLHYGGLGTKVQVVAGIEHEHGGKADGEVVRVHLVPGGLGGDAGQVVQQVHKAVLGSGCVSAEFKGEVYVLLGSTYSISFWKTI